MISPHEPGATLRQNWNWEDEVEFSRQFDRRKRKDKRRRRLANSVQRQSPHDEMDEDARTQLLLESANTIEAHSVVSTEYIQVATGLIPYEDIMVVIESHEGARRVANMTGVSKVISLRKNCNKIHNSNGMVPAQPDIAVSHKRLPLEMIQRIFSALLDEDKDHIVDAICLALTSKDYWGQFCYLCCDENTNRISKAFQLSYKQQMPLGERLNVWMGPKYRRSTPYKQDPSTVHRPITMFLSREVYGDKFSAAEKRLALRYKDCSNIIEDYGPQQLLLHYENFSHGAKEILPNPFGLGLDWYYMAAKCYRDKLLEWKDHNIAADKILLERIIAVAEGRSMESSNRLYMSHSDSWSSFKETHLWKAWVNVHEENGWHFSTRASMETWEERDVREDLEMVRRIVCGPWLDRGYYH